MCDSDSSAATHLSKSPRPCACSTAEMLPGITGHCPARGAAGATLWLESVMIAPSARESESDALPSPCPDRRDSHGTGVGHGSGSPGSAA